jgi:hypothetical protein
MMKLAAVLLVVGCNSSPPPAPAEKGSAPAPAVTAPTAPAAPIEDVKCMDAGKEYAKKMAKNPGNILSDAKPDDGLIYFAGVSMSDYCDGNEEYHVKAWTFEERSCVKTAEASAVHACFSGDSAAQVKAGLIEVVTSALANKKENDAKKAAEDAAGKRL